jgi:hypothetical protein
MSKTNKWKKAVVALGMGMCISCNDCDFRKEFENAKLKGDVMQVVKEYIMDEYVKKLKGYNKLSSNEKEALYNSIVEHIKTLDEQKKGELVKKAFEKLMVFLERDNVKKSMDKKGIMFDSVTNTAGRVFLKFPKASVAVIMNAAMKEDFAKYSLGVTLVIKAIYEKGDEETKDLIKSTIATMMSGENLFANMNAASFIVWIPIREYYAMKETMLLGLVTEYMNTDIGPEVAKFATEITNSIKEDREKNPEKQVEQVMPVGFTLKNIVPTPNQKSGKK